MTITGYSHAIFQNSSLFRSTVVELDKKENGGNENGLLDGNEIKLFEQQVKNNYNYDFIFDNLEQVKTKKINVKDANDNFIYTTGMEIAKAYGGATLTKTIDWLNNKEKGKDLIKFSTKTLTIPYMDNYEASVKNVNAQAEKAKEALAEKEDLDQKYANKHWFRNLIGITREKYEQNNERDY